MPINKSIFIIPDKNNKRFQKPGGGGQPAYLGEKSAFEQHKRDRVREIDALIRQSEASKTRLTNPDQLTFFEIKFHQKAISKSAQPKGLLDAGNIDVYAQKDEDTFFASTTEKNFASFRSKINDLDINKEEAGPAYLSAIEEIKSISKEDRLVNVDLELKEMKGFLFFHDVLSENSCKKIHSQIKEKYKIDSEFFISASGAKTVYGTFSNDFINEISEPYPANPIQSIEQSIEFTASESVSVIKKMDGMKVVDPEFDAVVGIIDSGIEKHALYKHLIIDTYDCIKDASQCDLSHGTLVGTRAIFGNDIEEQVLSGNTLYANTKVLDIKFLKKNGSKYGVSDKELLDCLTKTISKYGSKVKVYNLSFNKNGAFQHLHSGIRYYVSRELDALAYKNKVLFVISAGNQENFVGTQYPNCLLMDSSVITPPADSLNSIVVGAVADTGSSRSIAMNNEPSPLTRTGIIGTKKPDLVSYGGNIDKYGRSSGLGVKGFALAPDMLVESVGTSYSTPIVSQIAAKIYEYLRQTKYWNKPPIELTRALLLHSARYSLPSGSKIDENELSRIVGFGIPDFERALECAKSTATFIFSDTLGKKIKADNDKGFIRANKHKVQFIVPEELTGKNKKIIVRGTLVYMPQTNSAASLDNSLVDIETNLHYFNSNGTIMGGNLGENELDYRNKWNPIKHFEKTFTAYKGGLWEIWLTLNARGLADKEDYEQDYGFVISVEDATNDVKNQIDLHSLIRTKHPEYIQIDNLRTKVVVTS